MKGTGVLLLEPPEKIVESVCGGYLRRIDALLAADGIDRETAAELKKMIFAEKPGGGRCVTTSGDVFVNNVDRILNPKCRYFLEGHINGQECGIGLERQKATHLYPFICGVGIWSSEASGQELYSTYAPDELKTVSPLILNLRDQKLQFSPMGKLQLHFYNNIVKKRDRGVSVTPVALVWDRAHGYLPLYFGSQVWDMFPPSEMEKTMWALDHHIFRRNEKNSSYATSAFGDIFDVITNDAGQNVLDAYPVIYPVGDVTLDKDYARRLMQYVKNGGTLILNAELIAKYKNAFPEEFTGCSLSEKFGSSPATYSRLDQCIVSEEKPYSYRLVKPLPGSVIVAVTTDITQAPSILMNRYGKGKVIVTTPEHMKVRDSRNAMLKLFDHLMAHVRNHTLRIQVKTTMQYAINRSRTSWIVYLQNNFGLPPARGLFNTIQKTDVSKTASAVIILPESAGRVKRVIDWWTGKDVPFSLSEADGEKCTVLKTTLPGGDCQALEFVLE